MTFSISLYFMTQKFDCPMITLSFFTSSVTASLISSTKASIGASSLPEENKKLFQIVSCLINLIVRRFLRNLRIPIHILINKLFFRYCRLDFTHRNLNRNLYICLGVVVRVSVFPASDC